MTTNTDTPFSEVPSPASEALIFICEKCGKKINAEPEQNPSTILQQALKKEIKVRQLKGKVRALASSCLDICPKDQIAFGISYGQGGGDAFFTLTPSPSADLKTEILLLSQRITKP